MKLVKKGEILVGNDFPIEQIEKCAKEWQERLFLQEWELDCRYERKSDSFSTVSESRYTPSVKKASLVFLDPVDYELVCDYNDGDARDLEVEVVHELLHLKMWRLRPVNVEEDSREMDDFEQTVETLSRILVQMKRG